MKKGFFLNKNTVFLLFPVKLKSSCFFENLQIISKTYFLKIFLFFWKSSNNFHFFENLQIISKKYFLKILKKFKKKKFPTFWDFIYFPNILGFHSRRVRLRRRFVRRNRFWNTGALSCLLMSKLHPCEIWRWAAGQKFFYRASK